jgi:hypothetical protein
MKCFGNFLATSALMAVVAVGALAVTTVSASAATVCNSYGECWQTHQRYRTYPTTLGVHFYSDSWARRHHTDHRYQWRDRQNDDHGYYDHGTWHTFDERH